MSSINGGDLGSIRGLVIDMDGVLWHGDQALPGAHDFFDVLGKKEIKYLLATNNPSRTPEGFAAKAKRLGLRVRREQVITSGIATVEYLGKTYPPGSRIYPICGRALKDLIKGAGFILSEKDPVAVVVSMDPDISYEIIKQGTLLIWGGAEFIATNPDPYYPSEEGFLPGSGTLVEAFAASTARRPRVMGKPEPFMFELAAQRMGLRPSQIATIGDRLDTDVLGAERAGMKTILVLSGVTSMDMIESSSIKPTWIYPGIVEFTADLISSGSSTH